MKKIILFAAIALTTALGFHSCKSAETCPAYDSVSQVTSELPADKA